MYVLSGFIPGIIGDIGDKIFILGLKE